MRETLTEGEGQEPSVKATPFAGSDDGMWVRMEGGERWWERELGRPNYGGC